MQSIEDVVGPLFDPAPDRAAGEVTEDPARELEALRAQLGRAIGMRKRDLAVMQLLRLRIEELGTALRQKQEEFLDMLVRLQEREEQAVRRSEERFRLLVETVQDYAIVMLDPQGRIVSWNDGAERIIACSEREAVGAHVGILYPPDQSAAGKPARDLEEAARQGRFEEEGWKVRHHGPPFWASVVLSPLRNEDGRLLGFAKIMRDLTERRRAEEALRRTAAELERSNLELEQFAYVASHDLQEPLRKISAFGERLTTRYAPLLDEQGRDYVDRMRNAATRMQVLIDDVLTFSRVTRQPQRFQVVDLTQLAQEVASDLEPRLSATGGSMTISPLPQLEADPVHMRRLLQNLLANALKFHRPGIPPQVRVYAETERGPSHAPAAGLCRLFVQDNGIGFDERYLDRIFVIFQRLHGRSEYDGTGMGLAICRKIAERHGGSITARSVPGEGATFVVTLPLTQPPDEKHETES